MKNINIPIWVKVLLFIFVICLIPFIITGIIFAVPVYFFYRYHAVKLEKLEIELKREKLQFDSMVYIDKRDFESYRKEYLEKLN